MSNSFPFLPAKMIYKKRNPAEFKVLCIVAQWYAAKGYRGSKRSFSKKYGISVNTVRKSLKALIESGEIVFRNDAYQVTGLCYVPSFLIDLKPTDLRALMIISKKNDSDLGVSRASLAKNLGVKRAYAKQILDRLFLLGYVNKSGSSWVLNKEVFLLQKKLQIEPGITKLKSRSRYPTLTPFGILH